MKTSIIVSDECSEELKEFVSSVSITETPDSNMYTKEMGSIYTLYNFIDECQLLEDSLEFSIEPITDKQKVLILTISKNKIGIIKTH